MANDQDRTQDVYAILGELHSLDRRVSVLEARFVTAEARLVEMRGDLAGMKAEIGRVGEKIDGKLDAVADELRVHMTMEQKDRVKLLAGVLGTLVTAIVGLAAWALPRLWEHLEKL
jgi:hypothetical protein